MSYSTHSRPSTRSGQRYREMEVLSATPGELVLLVFDHLLTSLLRARAAIGAGDLEQRATDLGKARDAVAELMATLDREKGGEVAAQLARLYAFFLKELTMLSFEPQVARLDRIIAMVRDLREAFGGIQTGAAR